MSERKKAHPAHAPDMHEDEDEDDQPHVRPTTRKAPREEGRDQAIDEKDFAPLVPPRNSRPPQAEQRQKKKGPPVWQDPTAILETRGIKGLARAKQMIARFWAKREKVNEAFRNIINKLCAERNLRDLLLKHNHTSSAQFKKRTTHLDIPGRICDLYQHVVKTCSFCNKVMT